MTISPMYSPGLWAENLRIKQGGKTILEDVNLRVSPGEVTALVGPSGAGKSTLLRALAGEIKPAGGNLGIGPHPLQEIPIGKLARIRAVLPQDSSLHFPFKALDVVLMGRAPHNAGIERPLDIEIARKSMAFARISHLEERDFETLSGGERQRVHFARTLAQIWPNGSQVPMYLLLDEPTAHLDMAFAQALMQCAAHLTTSNIGVLGVFHDLNLAAQYADRVVILRNGRLLATGSPTEVFQPELLREAFGWNAIIIQHPTTGRPVVLSAEGDRGDFAPDLSA